MKEGPEVLSHIRRFTEGSSDLQLSYLQRLYALREALQISPFFSQHEVSLVRALSVCQLAHVIKWFCVLGRKITQAVIGTSNFVNPMVVDFVSFSFLKVSIGCTRFIFPSIGDREQFTVRTQPRQDGDLDD